MPYEAVPSLRANPRHFLGVHADGCGSDYSTSLADRSKAAARVSELDPMIWPLAKIEITSSNRSGSLLATTHVPLVIREEPDLVWARETIAIDGRNTHPLSTRWQSLRILNVKDCR
jgi:hypothetical protein